MNKCLKHLIICLSSLALVSLLISRLNSFLYVPGNIWDIAFFRLSDDEDIITHDYSKPDVLFSPQKKIRLNYHYVTGFADPFLFEKDGVAYIFYEKELFDEKGVICAFRSADLSRWEDIGEVLRVPRMHLSYPNVFELDGQIWMIPETHENKSVSLYHCKDFPFEWEKVTDLLVGDNYVDSCIHFRGGKYFLFTTTWRTDSAGLRVFESDSICGVYSEIPVSPVSESYSNMRCGGCLFEANNTLYRPAQYDENYYGENVMLFKVDTLSSVSYSESFVSSMLDHSNDWSKNGGHHFNSIVVNGERLVVMDGRVKDNFVNNRTRKLFNLIHGNN